MRDAEIVEMYWLRDENAIQETSKKYSVYLSKIANNILLNFEDTKECVNDTYLTAWNSMPENRPSNLSTYLGKIIRQISIDLYRRKHRQKRYSSEYALSLSELEDCFEGTVTVEQEQEYKLLEETINTFVRSLPTDSQRVFIGRYYFFDSVKAISAYCGISEPSVKTMLFRIRRSLKEYLVKEGFEL